MDGATTTDAPPARLKTRYLEEIRPALIERFGYSSVMQAPQLEKITLNMGVGVAKQDSKVLKAATEQLATIAGQQPSVRRARKSIAAFKLREGMPVGVAVTLRGERAYEFLDRLVSIAIPRIRDFRGLNPRSFDGRGNYSMGVARADHLPRDRLRRDRPGARPGHHDHDDAPRATSRRSRCCRRSACRSPRRAARRASTRRPTTAEAERARRAGARPPKAAAPSEAAARQPARSRPSSRAPRAGGRAGGCRAEAAESPRPPQRRRGRGAEAAAGRQRRRAPRSRRR